MTNISAIRGKKAKGWHRVINAAPPTAWLDEILNLPPGEKAKQGAAFHPTGGARAGQRLRHVSRHPATVALKPQRERVLYLHY